MLRRIFRKSVYYLNTIIGQVFYFMERRGLLRKVEYKTLKEIPGKKKVEFPYPENYEPKHQHLFAHYTNYETNDLVVYSFTEANISQEGIVFRRMNNSWLSFPHTGFRPQYGWLYMISQYWFGKKQKGKTDRTYVVLFDFWSRNNYYHWLVDALPRLLMVKDELNKTDVSLLLPENCSRFIFDTLRYFHLNDITIIKNNSFFRAPNLVLPYYTVGSGRIHPYYIRQVRDHFISKIDSSVVKERIYVSRGRQKARRIQNEQEVIKMLGPYNFEVIFWEDLSFEQQVQTVRHTKVLVSSHGANLTNCMFMPEHAKVMEIIREDHPNFCYWALATATQKKHYYHLCKVVGNDHLWVDIEQFRIQLEKLLDGLEA